MSMLDFAIKMEEDGGQYYLGQAEKNKGNALQPVFKLLAEAEEKHAELLRNRSEAFTGDVTESKIDGEENVFARLGDFKSEAVLVPDQMDVYLAAMEMEKKSIDLYQKMLQEATEPKVQQLLAFLVKEETSHFALFEELVEMLKRPGEWVESAEFGTREEY